MAHTDAARNYLTTEQVALLLKPIHPQRVLSLKNMAYVAGHDVRAELNRVFGFARWDQELLRQDLICEREVRTKAGSPAFYVLYRSTVRLSVRAADGSPLCFYDGTHVGESTHPVQGDAHGNAVTNSETYALRRAAINLGDQFGLSLYNKGSMDAIVRWTLVGNDSTADTDDIAKVEDEEQDVVQAVEQVATAGPLSPGARPLRKPKKAEPEKPRESTEITAQVLAQDAHDVKTVEELRGTWKLAGEFGMLQTVITDPHVDEHGEKSERKLTLQEYLLFRSSEISFPKSPGSTEGSGNAGGGSE
jgi:hypothetical protein